MGSALDDAILAVPAQQLPRRCGTCTACCTHLEVAALGKAGGVRCPHARGGCAIYPRRPDVCRGYACAWLEGLGGEEDRPDRSGVLIDFVFPHDDAVAQSARQVTVRAVAGSGETATRLLAEAVVRFAAAGVTATVIFSP